MKVLKRRRVQEAELNPFIVPEKKEVVEQIAPEPVMGDRLEFDAPFRQVAAVAINLYPVAGGVGLSTIVEASCGRLREPSAVYGVDVASAVILVASTSASHLAAAEPLIHAGRSPDGREVAGIILVHDRPDISRLTVKTAQRLIRAAPAGWVLPYVPALREVEATVKFPRRYRVVMEKIVKAVTSSQQQKSKGD